MASLNKHEVEHLVHHWIEHNEGHTKSFRERAGQIEELNADAALKVREAADLMELCTKKLVEAKELL